jgi:hypothetical protein
LKRKHDRKRFGFIKEINCNEQKRNELCTEYRGYENFWTDDDEILYRQELKEQLRVVNTATLVYGVGKLG